MGGSALMRDARGRLSVSPDSGLRQTPALGRAGKIKLERLDRYTQRGQLARLSDWMARCSQVSRVRCVHRAGQRAGRSERCGGRCVGLAGRVGVGRGACRP
eukprot:3845843-Prymnesium_polylepis.1